MRALTAIGRASSNLLAVWPVVMVAVLTAVFSTALAFEQAWRKGWGLTVQAQYWQSYLDDLGFEHFAEDTIQLGVTGSKGTNGWGEFLFGMSENSFSFKNSSDVTFHVGWRMLFE